MVRVLRSPLDSLSCALFPSSCALCGDPLLRLNLAPVCESCWNCLPPQSGTLCIRCGEDLGIAQFSTSPTEAENSRPQADLLCQPCRLAPPAFEKAVAYGAYEGSIRKLVHLLKYDGMRPVARRLGELLARSLEALPQPEDAARRQILVVPVPLHRVKHRRRGFNHATLLAQATVEAARNVSEVRRGDALSGRQWDLCLVPGMLERRRATVSQAGLTPRQRRQNLRGAFFAPRPGRLAGRHVLLIDDIYTTGATARACSRALLDAGAAAVWVVTVARAQREGVARWDGFFLRGSTRSQVDSWMKVQRESVEGQVSS